jgi:ABC-type oligopeptide transport system substrate-binding subunit
VNGYILPFDEPRFWYRSQFVVGGGCWGGYQNASFEELLNTADLQQPSKAGDAYVKAGRLLVEDAAYIGLLYTKRVMLIKPYVKGAGFNTIYDDPWSEIEILKH